MFILETFDIKNVLKHQNMSKLCLKWVIGHEKTHDVMM
jgi:hypothetical protein